MSLIAPNYQLTCPGKDRPLTHINKKGRPVSQCPHCRGLRKARASHVKCDCGEKPHSKQECLDYDKTESGSEHGDSGVEASPDISTPSVHGCCCSHGSRCVCAVKKEHLDPVPEVDFNEITPPPSIGARKPRLMTAQSETSLTVFTNGHHKPVHKLNDSAHHCGIPYKIPIPHSVPGNSETVKESARRSTDSLPLPRTMEQAPKQLQESISSAQQEVRLVRSEHGSPKPRAFPRYEGIDGSIPPLDLSYPHFNHGMPSPLPDEYNYSSSNGYEPYFTSPEEAPILSAGLISPVEDWSAVDLPLDSSAFSATYSQPASYTSFDRNIGQPGLTTSSSGEVSEVDDYISQYPLKSEPVTSTSPVVSDSGAYRLSSTSSYMSIPQASILSDSSHDMDTFLHATASPTELEKSEYPGPLGSGTFSRHGFTVQDAQKLAHPNASTEAIGELSLPPAIDDHDPLWAVPFNSDEASYDPNSISTNAWARQ